MNKQPVNAPLFVRGGIHGLSLTRPWPWAFMNGPIPKRIENRTWMPTQLSVWVALHSAKSWDEEARTFIKIVTGLYVPSKSAHAESQIFAVCRVTRCPAIGAIDWPNLFPEDPVIPPEQYQWAFGPFCWYLEDFVALENPIPCSGGQGLWDISQRKGVLDLLQEEFYRSLTLVSCTVRVKLSYADLIEIDNIESELKRIALHRKWYPVLMQIKKAKEEEKEALYQARLALERLPLHGENNANSPYGLRLQDIAVKHEEKLTQLNRDEGNVYSKMGCAIERYWVTPRLGMEFELKEKLAQLKGRMK